MPAVRRGRAGRARQPAGPPALDPPCRRWTRRCRLCRRRWNRRCRRRWTRPCPPLPAALEPPVPAALEPPVPPLPAALDPPVPAVLDPPVPALPPVPDAAGAGGAGSAGAARCWNRRCPLALEPPVPATLDPPRAGDAGSAGAPGAGPADAACARSPASAGAAATDTARSGEQVVPDPPAPGRCEADQEYEAGKRRTSRHDACRSSAGGQEHRRGWCATMRRVEGSRVAIEADDQRLCP